MFEVLREVSKANRISTVAFRREDFWLFEGSAEQDPVGDCPGGHGSPRELAALQGQPLQSTRTAPSSLQREEQAPQKASTEQHGTLTKRREVPRS